MPKELLDDAVTSALCRERDSVRRKALPGALRADRGSIQYWYREDNVRATRGRPYPAGLESYTLPSC